MEVLPVVDDGDLAVLELPIQSQAELFVEQADVDASLAVGVGPMHVHIVVGARLRSLGHSVVFGADGAVRGPLGALAAVEDEARSFVEEGEAGVAVIHEHEGRTIDSEVFDAVADVDAPLAEHGRNLARQL